MEKKIGSENQLLFSVATKIESMCELRASEVLDNSE